ncbi:MAG: Gfo/Idh/MocA family protein [Parvibaculaceae bacterium]
MLRAASIGLGWWADELASSVHGKSDSIAIAGGFSRSADKRKAFSEKFGARTYDSYGALLDDPGIDAVILSTPHSLHAAQVTEAARAGKHVFVEKPFAMTAESGETAARACEAAGVVLAVGHNRRFAPAAVELKRMLEAGEFGTLLHIETNFSAPSAMNWTEAHWRASREESPAGGLAGLGIHVIDIVAWLGGRIEEVRAQAVRRALKVDNDDTTSALFRLSSGATAYMGAIAAAPFTCWCNVYGTSANAFAIDDLTELWVLPSGGKKREQKALPRVDTLKAELEAFADACAGRASFPGIAPPEAIHAVAVMQAIAASAGKGGASVAVAG